MDEIPQITGLSDFIHTFVSFLHHLDLNRRSHLLASLPADLVLLYKHTRLAFM